MGTEERAFALFNAGQVRDGILASFRNGLRELINPDTGAPFTHDEIMRATQVGTRYWIEADAIDKALLAEQSRALYLSDQIQLERATTDWLVNYHAKQWGEERLAPTGGFGEVTAEGSPGTVFVGSTTVPDPGAHVARDEAGLKYQVYRTATVDPSGKVALSLIGVDTGRATNLKSGAKLTWINPPLGAGPSLTVKSEFSGGTDLETDAEFSSRIRSRIIHKPGGGNLAHFRAWGRAASNAVEDAFVYACTPSPGSVLVAFTQKRAGNTGPYARLPNMGTLERLTAELVPPGSSFVPEHVSVVVCGPTPQPTDFSAQLALPKGNATGWADQHPWPEYETGVASVTAILGEYSFCMRADTEPPLSAPKLMFWRMDESEFVPLDVDSIKPAGDDLYEVKLRSSVECMPGDYISPMAERYKQIADAVESYFDELGPGEMFDFSNPLIDPRCARFPELAEEWPARAGQAFVSRLQDTLGASLADSRTTLSATPVLPSDPAGSPSLLVIGNFAVYDLP